MAAVLIDTTILIDALRGRGAASRLRGLRRTGDLPFVCAINVEEVWRGAKPDEEEESIGRLLRGLRIAPLAAGRASWRAAGAGSSPEGRDAASGRLSHRRCRTRRERVPRHRQPAALPDAGPASGALAGRGVKFW